MATYEITSPTGEVFDITAPDDATEEQVMAYAKSQFSGQQPSQPQPQEQLNDRQRLVRNVIPSAQNLAGDIANTFLHPLDTAEAMANLFFGVGDKITGTTPADYGGEASLSTPQEAQQRGQMTDAVGAFMKDRYIDNPYESFIQDPVGMGTDVLGLLAGGSGLAMKAPGQVGRYAGLVNKAANSADIINMAGKATGKVASGVGSGATHLIGEMTGVGGGAAQRALNRTTEVPRVKDGSITDKLKSNKTSRFQEGKTGDYTPTDAIDEAQTLTQGFVDNIRKDYLESMDSIEAWHTPTDISTLSDSLQSAAKKYHLKPTFDNSGNFKGVERTSGQSRIGQDSIEEINKVYSETIDWRKGKGNNLSPADLDGLKGRLDNLFSKDSQASAFMTEVRQSVRKQISDGLPPKDRAIYDKAMKKYQKYNHVLKQVKQVFSLENAPQVDIDKALKKFSSTFRQNFEGRDQILKVSKELGLDFDSVMDGIAGLQMASPTGRGLMGKMSIGAGLMGGGAAMTGGIPFSTFGLLLLTSPKAMSSTLGAIGWSKKQINKLMSSPGFKQLKKGVTTTPGRAITSNLGRYSDLINNQLQPQE